MPSEPDEDQRELKFLFHADYPGCGAASSLDFRNRRFGMNGVSIGDTNVIRNVLTTQGFVILKNRNTDEADYIGVLKLFDVDILGNKIVSFDFYYSLFCVVLIISPCSISTFQSL